MGGRWTRGYVNIYEITAAAAGQHLPKLMSAQLQFVQSYKVDCKSIGKKFKQMLHKFHGKVITKGLFTQ